MVEAPGGTARRDGGTAAPLAATIHAGPTLAAMRRPKPGTATGVLLVLVALTLAACGSSSQHHSTAPQTTPVSGQLIGVTFDGPVFAPTVNLGQQVRRAVASGAESVRVAVDWPVVQPYRAMSEVPASLRSRFVDVGGVPTNFGSLDRLVAAAAAHRLSVLPVVEYTPSWNALHPGNPASPPRSEAAYAVLLTALVKRYGPQGSFWSAHPALARDPIRMWQIWNEPHFTSYWSDQPFASSYVRLLAAAHAALKAADPGAKVVLAGLADFSWRYLADIYRVPGAQPPLRHRRGPSLYGPATGRDHHSPARPRGHGPLRGLHQAAPRHRDHLALVGGQGAAPVRRQHDRRPAGPPTRSGHADAGGQPIEARAHGLLLVHVDGQRDPRPSGHTDSTTPGCSSTSAAP